MISDEEKENYLFCKNPDSFVDLLKNKKNADIFFGRPINNDFSREMTKIEKFNSVKQFDKLKTDKKATKSKCKDCCKKILINPNNTFIQCYEILTTIVVTYSCTEILFRISFGENLTPYTATIEDLIRHYTIEVYFLINIILSNF
jgi:hypothetical protein